MHHYGMLGIAAIALLAGCNKPSESAQLTAIEAHTAKTGADMANQQIVEMTERLNAMDGQIRQLREGQSANYAYIKSVDEAHERLRTVFNGNVEMDNKASVARMTARGACGTERVTYQDGGWAMRNKECTIKDLR